MHNIFFRFVFYSMYMDVLLECMFALHACLVPMVARSGIWISWNWSN